MFRRAVSRLYRNSPVVELHKVQTVILKPTAQAKRVNTTFNGVTATTVAAGDKDLS
jgi:hypothetical protein